MMSAGEDASLADCDHTSGGHTVTCSLLLGMVMRRTSAPSVRHMVRANVPSGGPVEVVLEGAMFTAPAADYLRKCALLCVAWFAFDFRRTEGNASGTRRTRRTCIEETQP